MATKCSYGILNRSWKIGDIPIVANPFLAPGEFAITERQDNIRRMADLIRARKDYPILKVQMERESAIQKALREQQKRKENKTMLFEAMIIEKGVTDKNGYEQTPGKLIHGPEYLMATDAESARTKVLINLSKSKTDPLKKADQDKLQVLIRQFGNC